MITEEQFKNAAAILGCDVAAIKTVYQVEAAGKGYLADGRVKILFEGHRLWKNLVKAGIPESKLISYTTGKFHSVLYKDWTKDHYIGGAGEWNRVSLAIELCKELGVAPEAALDSTSFGSFQIMGENAEACGYSSAQQMLADYNNGGEAEQLMSFVRFVKSRKLSQYLVTHNWAKFAEGYNGTGYRLNNYDTKMTTIYKSLTK